MTAAVQTFEPDAMSIAIGAWLKQIRKAKTPHLSRRVLSERCGISASTIRAIEDGERSVTLRNLLALATALDVGAMLVLCGADVGIVSIPLDEPCPPTPSP